MIPEIFVSNLHASLKFYIDILGFKKEYERTNTLFTFLSFQKSQLMLQELTVNEPWLTAQIQKPFGRGINFQIEVQSVDSLYTKILNAKLTPFKQLTTETYMVQAKAHSQREFLIQDPDGYLLRFAQFLS